jgi:hypothetical protein
MSGGMQTMRAAQHKISNVSPKIKEIEMELTLEYMQKFCEPDHYTGFYLRPVPLNGKTIASNGHILVCVDADLGAEPYDNLPASMAAMVDPGNFVSGFVPLDIVLADQPACSTCLGFGKTPKKLTDKCPDCEGTGEHYIGSHYYECKECDGEGEVGSGVLSAETEPCEACKATGRQYTIQRIDARSFNVEYLRMILELPSIEYQPDHDNSDSTMRFRFDGGVGVLMPVRV